MGDNLWNFRFSELAALVASWSKDPSTKVGCVIVDRDRRVVGMGYNGFPRGVRDTPARLNDRPTKYLMVQHAEANAVLNAAGPVKGCVAYVTHQPCANCTGLLIQAGIAEIHAPPPDPALAERFSDSFKASEAMLFEAGVNLVSARYRKAAV